MRVIILADRTGTELLPLTDQTCPAMLPVAGKPVVEHTLDMLAGAGLKRALVVIGPFADQLREFLGDGQRWGMALEFWATRGEEEPAAVLAQLSNEPGELLFIRGDLLRTPCLAGFLAQAALLDEALVQATLAGQAGGISLCRPAASGFSPVHWPALAASLPPVPAVDFPDGKVSLLQSLPAYHQANLDAAAGRFTGLLLPGRQTALGLTQGRNTQVSPRSLKVGIAFVGAGCRINATAEFSGEVVICDHVIIDAHARLTDTLVLPHSYVGQLVDLRNAIVRGNDLIRVDTGAHLHLADAFLLADLQKISLGYSLAPSLHRLAGGILLLLSLPLWPLAAYSAYRNNPVELLHSRRLRGNRIELTEFGERRRAEFTCWEWASPRPLLRALPRLLAVVGGHLRMVGVEAVSQEQAERRIDEWELLADQAPAGLIGPTQLRLPADAPEEERLMSDAFFASQQGRWASASYLWEGFLALFGRRAWGL